MSANTTSYASNAIPFRGDREGWDLAGSTPLSAEELAQTIDDYKKTANPESCNRIIVSHLRLVAKIARRFSGRSIPMDDLMAEGALSLRRALDNFNPSRGVSFTSYASVVVAFAVRNAARTHHEHFRIPSRERRRSALRQGHQMRFFLEHGRQPTIGEISEQDATLTRRRRRSSAGVLALPKACVSLDADSAAGHSSGAGLIADQQPSPMDIVADRDDVKRVNEALETLPPEVARVVRMRFGLGGQPALALAEIAHALKVPPSIAERAVSEGIRRLRVAFSTPAVLRHAGRLNVPSDAA